MPKHDIYTVLFRTLESATKMSILFLLSHHGEMTVTQMSKFVAVGRPTLYHFVGQMVRDRLLSAPRAISKRNYVEKYYRLNESMFALIDPSEQRKRITMMPPENARAMLQAFLASLGFYLRLVALEITNADQEKIRRIKRSISENQIMLSYLILPDEPYRYVLSEIRRVNKTIGKKWKGEKWSLKGNRLIILGLPEL